MGVNRNLWESPKTYGNLEKPMGSIRNNINNCNSSNSNNSTSNSRSNISSSRSSRSSSNTCNTTNSNNNNNKNLWESPKTYGSQQKPMGVNKN